MHGDRIWSTTQLGAPQCTKGMEIGGLKRWMYVERLKDLGLFCMEKAEDTAACVLTITFWEGVEMIEPDSSGKDIMDRQGAMDSSCKKKMQIRYWKNI